MSPRRSTIASYAAIADEVRDRLRNVEFPFEHRAEIVGDSAQGEARFDRIIGVCIVALILAYLLLQAALRSWGMSLIVLATLPAGLAGGAGRHGHRRRASSRWGR